MVVKCNNRACKFMSKNDSEDIHDWMCMAGVIDLDWKFGSENWDPCELSCLSFEENERV